MMPKYFDIHSHLHFSDYDSDREVVLARLKETETYTIVVGTSLESSRRAVALAEKFDEVYACIGIHPTDDSTLSFNEKDFELLIKSPKVVAVGECGLDFFHADKNKDYERQKNLFLTQINFALKHDKPIMIHSRNAYEELLDILEPVKKLHSKLKGNVHFFAGGLEVANRFFNLGFTVSFTGVITFTKDYDEVIRHSPIESILSETDAPYVAPVPYRGGRNEPAYVSEVVKRIAEIRGEDTELVRKALVVNACREFGLVLE